MVRRYAKSLPTHEMIVCGLFWEYANTPSPSPPPSSPASSPPPPPTPPPLCLLWKSAATPPRANAPNARRHATAGLAARMLSAEETWSRCLPCAPQLLLSATARCQRRGALAGGAEAVRGGTLRDGLVLCFDDGHGRAAGAHQGPRRPFERVRGAYHGTRGARLTQRPLLAHHAEHGSRSALPSPTSHAEHSPLC
jgi:hypothetical protein